MIWLSFYAAVQVCTFGSGQGTQISLKTAPTIIPPSG